MSEVTTPKDLAQTIRDQLNEYRFQKLTFRQRSRRKHIGLHCRITRRNGQDIKPVFGQCVGEEGFLYIIRSYEGELYAALPENVIWSV